MRIPFSRFISRSYAGRALVVIAVLSVTLLTISRSFTEMGFYYDDWSYVQQLQQGGSVSQQFPSRLLHQPVVELMFGFVGYEPVRGYFIVAAMLLASVLAMYWMVSALFPRMYAFAALSTVLFALYPGDVSRLWMSAGMTSNRPAVLMALIALAALFTALRIRHGHRRTAVAFMAFSIAVYAAGLFLYEAQAALVPGLGFAGALWIAWSGRGLSYRRARRRAFTGAVKTTAPYALVLAGMVAWRALFLEGEVEDGYLATANFDLKYLSRQLLGAYYFNFLEQPWEVLREGAPFMGRLGLQSLGFAALAAAIVAGSLFSLSYRRRKSDLDDVRTRRVSPEAIAYRNIFLAGVALTAVVYAVLLPHDHIISASGLRGPFVSRLNTSAGVIVAMTVAAALMLGWSLLKAWLPRAGWRVDAGASVAVGGMALLLIAFHGIVQDDYAAAWDLQKKYTSEIVASAPSVEPGTHFVISGVPTKHRSSYVYMFSVEHMLKLVYSDETIRATAINEGFNDWRLDATGLYRREELIASADRIVFMRLSKSGCGVKSGPECGRLVLSQNVGQEIVLAGALGPDAILALTNYSRINSDVRLPSPVDDLLGIELWSATVTEPPETGSHGPGLAAPGEPPVAETP